MHLKEARKRTLTYINDGIEYVCKNFKDRSPGSKSERSAQAYFAKELSNWADDVKVERFKLSPKAFMGFIPVCAIFMISVAILFYLQRWYTTPVISVITVVLGLLSLSMFIFEFLLYREFVDFLFPKHVSKNVYAVRKPSGEVKRRIVFGGHADAAWEWTYSLYGQIKTLAPVLLGSILGMIFSLIVNIAYLFSGRPEITGKWHVFAIIQLILIFFYIALLFFINWKVIVDGANDNLSACFASMAIIKEMAENDFRFEHTEVGVIITGSEEAGLRGALAFGKRHAEELNAVETIMIPLETLRETDQLAVYNLDQTGTVRNDPLVAELLIDAGKRIGIDLPKAPIYPGSTDAAAFTRTGLMACGLGGVNHDPQKYYHTRYDTYDNISLDCIDKTIDICFEAAIIFDKTGLDAYK